MSNTKTYCVQTLTRSYVYLHTYLQLKGLTVVCTSSMHNHTMYVLSQLMSSCILYCSVCRPHELLDSIVVLVSTVQMPPDDLTRCEMCISSLHFLLIVAFLILLLQYYSHLPCNSNTALETVYMHSHGSSILTCSSSDSRSGQEKIIALLKDVE